MPRKSETGPDVRDSTANGTSGSSGGGNLKDGLSIDDQTLPKSIVTRLAKGVLPQNTNVQKDAILALSKGGTVFINYLCATANDQAKLHGRKTINPKDILEAMHLMEFDDFLPRLKAELEKFNELASEKRASTKKLTKTKDSGIITPNVAKHQPSDISNASNDSPPAAKKLRVGGVANDSGTTQVRTTGSTGNSVPVRGWGDEDEEEDEEMGDDDDDEPEDSDESESEEFAEDESDVVLDEGDAEDSHDKVADEALDNGIDSD